MTRGRASISEPPSAARQSGASEPRRAACAALPRTGRRRTPWPPAHRIHRQARGQELRAAVAALAARLTAALADQP
jgi:hypothetical protein